MHSFRRGDQLETQDGWSRTNTYSPIDIQVRWVLLIFNFCFLVLAICGWYRSPAVGGIRGIWFAMSLLPAELPWAFALIQLIGSTLLLLFFSQQSWVLVLAGIAQFISLWLWHRSHKRTFAAEKSLFNALQDLPTVVRTAGGLIASPAEQFQQHAKDAITSREWLRPFSYSRQGVERLANIRYGEHPRLQLDIYRPTILPAQPAPVLLHIHGGGWIMGNKHQQAQPLLRHMAVRGWICVDINYRLAPRYRYPECLLDAKRALAWIKREIAGYGGNPAFVAVTGGSAGGHLAAMMALTANAPVLQPDFVEADTRVQAAVLMYGAYDFTNSNSNWAGASLERYLRRFVMSPDSQTPYWRDASPKFNLSAAIPPIFAIHGSNDALIFVEDARDFVTSAKTISSAPVIYAELDGAQHGFDLFHSVRTELSIRAVEQFLEFSLHSK